MQSGKAHLPIGAREICGRSGKDRGSGPARTRATRFVEIHSVVGGVANARVATAGERTEQRSAADSLRRNLEVARGGAREKIRKRHRLRGERAQIHIGEFRGGVVGWLRAQIERDGTEHLASIELRACIRKCQLAAVERGVRSELAESERRESELANGNRAMAAKPCWNRLRLGLRGEERQNAVEKTFAALWVEPTIHFGGVKFIRGKRELPTVIGGVALESAVPIRAEGIGRG